jgi:ATP-dependent DNA helicase RecG
MSPKHLARLFQERSQSRVIRFDETPVPGTLSSDLDPELARRFLREEPHATNLRKLRLVADDEDGATQLTVAGVLLCTAEPQTWLPHAEIQAVSYLGERPDLHYQVDARDIGGPLDRQILEGLHFVRRNMFISATKVLGRVDRPQFSERAIFEALVNAVAHRDYSMAGARIRLHLFLDRLELFVPGGLANTLTTDSMVLRQYSRNELIVSLLARCPVPEREHLGRSHLMDRRGDGVPIILAESEQLSGRKPRYEVLDDSELRLIIWANSPLSAAEIT